MNDKNRIYTIVAVIIAVAICIGIIVYKIIDSNSDFALEDENRYIIELHEAFTNTYSYNEYYEADFNKNKVILRRDDEGYKRENMGKLKKENCEKLKSLIEEIASKKENEKEILEEQIHILYRQNVSCYYTIKSYDNKVYYVKDNSDIKKMQEILL